VKDIVWLRPDGSEMTPGDWSTAWIRSLGVLLPASGLNEMDEHGRKQEDDTLFVMLNAYFDPVKFKIPAAGEQSDWQLLVTSEHVESPAPGKRLRWLQSGQAVELCGRSLMLLKAVRREPSGSKPRIDREAK
jgi:glycogen operon protein